MNYKIAEVSNLRSHYYGEVVCIKEEVLANDEKWYKAESLHHTYEVYFKEEELEFETD